MREVTRQQQEQIDAQARALDEMKAMPDSQAADQGAKASRPLRGLFVSRGNRRATVTLYGHITCAILAADDKDAADVYPMDNESSQSRFGMLKVPFLLW